MEAAVERRRRKGGGKGLERQVQTRDGMEE